MIEVVCTRDGQPAHGQLLGPLITDPPPEVLTDGGHDLTALPTDATWWIAHRDNLVLATAAAWPDPDDTAALVCGLNIELGWRTRDERWWPLAHRARQLWLTGQARPASTWLHDEPPSSGRTSMVVARHLLDGWVEVAAGWSRERPGQWCRRLVWQP